MSTRSRKPSRENKSKDKIHSAPFQWVDRTGKVHKLGRGSVGSSHAKKGAARKPDYDPAPTPAVPKPKDPLFYQKQKH
jgi:hypothetical protein